MNPKFHQYVNHPDLDQAAKFTQKLQKLLIFE